MWLADLKAIYRSGGAMVAHLAHNQETPFKSDACNHLDAHSNYSFRINLAQRVERKCFKLKVVGSNPTIYSFASSICLGSSVGSSIRLKI